MTENDVRDKILFLFNQQRKKPDDIFDESHFMDFLKNPCYPRDSMKNSFKGARTYYKFMDLLELEFKICFKLADLDRYYSLDGLTKKVLERIEKVNSNIYILSERNKRKESFRIELFLGIILIICYLLLRIHWLSIIITLVFSFVLWWLNNNRRSNKKHLEKLNLKFKEQE